MTMRVEYIVAAHPRITDLQNFMSINDILSEGEKRSWRSALAF